MFASRLLIALMMSQHRMRYVRCFQFGYLLIRELEVYSGNCILEMVRLGCANDRSSDSGLVQQPGQGDLGWGHSAPSGQLFYTIDYAVICLASVEFVGIVVSFGAQRTGLAVSSKKSTRQRAPGNYSDAFCPAERNHFTFFFAVNEVVVVLHGYKTGEAVNL